MNLHEGISLLHVVFYQLCVKVTCTNECSIVLQHQAMYISYLGLWRSEQADEKEKCCFMTICIVDELIVIRSSSQRVALLSL